MKKTPKPHATPEICGAKTRSGKPCTQYPIRGGTRCRMHGGKARQVLAAAQRRVITAALQDELAERGWGPLTDPVTAYADLAGEAWAWKELVRDKIGELRSWTVTNVITGVPEVQALLQVYEHSLDRAQKMLADMLRIGLTAEHLRQARERPTAEQAEALSHVLDHVLDQLDLTPEQRDRVPAALTAALTQEGLL